MIEINKIYRREIRDFVRYATVKQLDLMDNQVLFSIVDKDKKGNTICREYPFQILSVVWFTELYLKNTNHDRD